VLTLLSHTDHDIYGLLIYGLHRLYLWSPVHPRVVTPPHVKRIVHVCVKGVLWLT
jgi:hypothetical protein